MIPSVIAPFEFSIDDMPTGTERIAGWMALDIADGGREFAAIKNLKKEVLVWVQVWQGEPNEFP